VDEIISQAREAAEDFTAELPDFVVQQLTARYYSSTVPAKWRALDVVSAEVVSVNGKEEYRNISRNGKRTRQPIETTGSWSTGEFVTTLQDVLSPITAAEFVKRAENRIANRPAYVYDFRVQPTGSHWKIIAQDGSSETPAYKGTIWIDKESGRVLRIEQRTSAFSPNFQFDNAESTLDYDFVSIEGERYLLPVRSENLSCSRGSLSCTRNQINFRNYRKFEAQSEIKFGKLQ
jgi:hypothetical protein